MFRDWGFRVKGLEFRVQGEVFRVLFPKGSDLVTKEPLTSPMP